MKNRLLAAHLIVFKFVFMSHSSFSQVSIISDSLLDTGPIRMGIGTLMADTSAVLEVKSTRRGILLPRMTAAQRNSIPIPSNGLLVYQTNELPGFYYYSGTSWLLLGSSNTANTQWQLSGNTGTDPSNSFIGTTDNKDLSFRVNNVTAGRISHSSKNTSLGSGSLINQTTGIKNTAVGNRSLQDNTTGSFNTAIGDSALFNNTTGTYNTAIGHFSRTNSTGLTNATAIGFGAVSDASNRVRIGNTTVTSIGGQVGWTKFSDGRYKNNIRENVPGLAFIKLLRPVTYIVDIPMLNRHLHGVANPFPLQTSVVKKVETGFLAQEVEKAAEKIGYDFSGIDIPQDAEKGTYGLRYEEFIMPMVKAIQELSAENESLRKRIEKIESAGSKSGNTEKSNDTSRNTIYINAISDAYMEQNIPNPFGSSTSIHYYIPEYVNTAAIQVLSISGKILLTIAISQRGAGQLFLNASRLTKGLYYYTLIIDGQKITTLKMISNQ